MQPRSFSSINHHNACFYLHASMDLALHLVLQWRAYIYMQQSHYSSTAFFYTAMGNSMHSTHSFTASQLHSARGCVKITRYQNHSIPKSFDTTHSLSLRQAIQLSLSLENHIIDGSYLTIHPHPFPPLLYATSTERIVHIIIDASVEVVVVTTVACHHITITTHSAGTRPIHMRAGVDMAVVIDAAYTAVHDAIVHGTHTTQRHTGIGTIAGGSMIHIHILTHVQIHIYMIRSIHIISIIIIVIPSIAHVHVIHIVAIRITFASMRVIVSNTVHRSDVSNAALVRMHISIVTSNTHVAVRARVTIHIVRHTDVIHSTHTVIRTPVHIVAIHHHSVMSRTATSVSVDLV